jgi:hypothetical protein
MQALVRLAFGIGALVLVARTLSAPADAAASDSVVQFKVTSASIRLSHDMKIGWAGAINATQCTSVTITPGTDKFPGEGMANLKIPVAELTNLWLKAGDVVKADDSACALLVTGLYTDATFTRPLVP